VFSYSWQWELWSWAKLILGVTGKTKKQYLT